MDIATKSLLLGQISPPVVNGALAVSDKPHFQINRVASLRSLLISVKLSGTSLSWLRDNDELDEVVCQRGSDERAGQSVLWSCTEICSKCMPIGIRWSGQLHVPGSHAGRSFRKLLSRRPHILQTVSFHHRRSFGVVPVVCFRQEC